MTVPEDIENLRNHLYARAEGLWWATFWIAVGTQIFVLLAIWIDRQGIVTVVGLATVAIPVLITWLRERANITALRADKCRRLILYADGLGRPITKEELAEVRAWAMKADPAKAQFIVPYYSSTKTTGPSRLADIVAESSFFTCQLSERVMTILWIIFLTSLGIAFSILFLSELFPLADVDKGTAVNSIEKLAKSTALLIVFLISGDFLLLIKKYADLHSLASDAFRRCSTLRDQEPPSESQVLLIVEDYHIGLNQSPPIPVRLYNRYSNELNKIYRESHDQQRR